MPRLAQGLMSERIDHKKSERTDHKRTERTVNETDHSASPILNSECHLHLYGCLSKESLFELGAERATQHPARVQWFISEYHKATGLNVNPEHWWHADDGFETFKKNFLCDSAVPFSIFQAKFNLLIALFPPVLGDMTLPRTVFQHHAKNPGFKEYRTFLPMYLPAEDRARYLTQIIETAAAYETSTYHPRIAISFVRQNTEAMDSYGFLKDFLKNHASLAPWITGIDFCGNEQGHPPTGKESLFSQILNDNLKRSHPLEILYHVGEMWQDIAIHSAARWCVKSAQMGAHRLGHALALGMDSESVRGLRMLESKMETEQHFAWLRAFGRPLHEFGFTPNDHSWLLNRADANTCGDQVAWVYDTDLITHTTRFQNAAMSMVRELGPIIEICPTSNMRIGALRETTHHPLERFARHQLNYVISTDDPGLFDISLGSEECFVKENMGLSREDLVASERRTESIFTKVINQFLDNPTSFSVIDHPQRA
jgi:Adenosine deaminase